MLLPGIVASNSSAAAVTSASADFANSSYTGGTLGSLLAVTQALTTYAPTSAGLFTAFAPNVQRVTDLGLFSVEAAHTNLFLHTDFNGTWAYLRASSPTGSAFAPTSDGATPTQKLQETAVAGTHAVFQSATKAASALAYNFVVYAKAEERTRIAIEIDDAATRGIKYGFDLAGVQIAYGPTSIGTPFTSVSASIASLPGGWCKCVVQATSDSVTTIRALIFTDDGSGTAAESTSFTGTLGSGVDLWQPKLEQVASTALASFGPIPTTTAAVTQAADITTLTGAFATLLAATAGTAGVFLTQGASFTQNPGTLIDANGTTLLGRPSASRATTAFGATQKTGAAALTGATTGNAGIAWSAAGFTLMLGNGVGVRDAAAAVPTGPFYLGSTGGSSNAVQTPILSVSVQAAKMTDAQLSALLSPTPAVRYTLVAATNQYVGMGAAKPPSSYDATQPWTSHGSIAPNNVLPSAPAVICTNVQTTPLFPGIDFGFIGTEGFLYIRLINDIRAGTASYIEVHWAVQMCDLQKHNFQISYDGSVTAAGVIAVIDGVQRTNIVGSDNLIGSIVSGTQNLIFLNQFNHLTDFFCLAPIVAFSISNIARSVAYGQANNVYGFYPTDDTSAMSFGMYEGSGTTLSDLSGSTVNGTLVASPTWAVAT